MPFSKVIVPEKVFTSAIKPAINENNMETLIIKEEIIKGSMIYYILNSIWHSTLVIADITGDNPNVFYELGLAHAMGKQVIQITTKTEKIPFDIANNQTVSYNLNHLQDLKKHLTERIKVYIKSKF